MSSLSLSKSPSWTKWSIAQPGWKSSSNLEEATNPTNKKHKESPKRQDILVIVKKQTHKKFKEKLTKNKQEFYAAQEESEVKLLL